MRHGDCQQTLLLHSEHLVALKHGLCCIQEELQNLEMTTGFSDSLRSHALPRRCVKIKRPGKANKMPNGNSNIRTGVRLHVNDSRTAAQQFLAGSDMIGIQQSIPAPPDAPMVSNFQLYFSTKKSHSFQALGIKLHVS